MKTRKREIRKDWSIRIVNVLPKVEAQPGVAFPIIFKNKIRIINATATPDIRIEKIKILTAVVSIITDIALSP